MENAPVASDTANQGSFSTTITALMEGWMLQNTRTIPAWRKVTVRLIPGGYSPKSKICPLNVENALWEIGSRLGKATPVPTWMASTCGINAVAVGVPRAAPAREGAAGGAAARAGSSHTTTPE